MTTPSDTPSDWETMRICAHSTDGWCMKCVNDNAKVAFHWLECWREGQRDLAALREQLSVMTQAVGLASTIKGEMPMRPDDPIGMMQEVVAFVAALREQLDRLKAELESANRAYADVMRAVDECGSYKP